MTNNFKEIRNFMRNEMIPEKDGKSGDLFFCIMLIRRGKDHPNLPAANYTFKSYYIDSLEKYDKVKDEIIKCCDLFKLRAYVSVNVKSKEAFSKYCAVKFSENVFMNEYKKPWRVIDHVFGKLTNKNEDKWIIDCDNCTIDSNYAKEIIRLINLCDSKYDESFITSIKTKSGLHIISHPFNLKQFSDLCEYNKLDKPEVKKNHITLLYENI